MTLPIYHGTEETILQVASGHIPGTSLPIGGEPTHCVLSGHRGLPSARLFTDLDQLTPGDAFTIDALGKILTYEVDQIHIVLPYELDDLEIIPDKDYVTLVTCTPYGINSHRLLVRGTRIQTNETLRITAEAAPVSTSIVITVLIVTGGIILTVRHLPDIRRKMKTPGSAGCLSFLNEDLFSAECHAQQVNLFFKETFFQ